MSEPPPSESPRSPSRLKRALVVLSVLALAGGGAYGAYAYWYLSLWKRFPVLPDDAPLPALLVAHAGGAHAGHVYTNTLEALDAAHAAGHRLIEVDFLFSSDGHLVLAHPKGLPDPEVIPSHEEFLASRPFGGLTTLDVEGLMRWLGAHPDVTLVTDLKAEDAETFRRGMAAIRDAGPALLERMIVQIFVPEQLEVVKELGYPHALFTLYHYKKLDRREQDLIFEFATRERERLVAITVHQSIAAHEPLTQKLVQAGLPVLAHTVNGLNAARKLKAAGVVGIYSDHFQPGRDGFPPAEEALPLLPALASPTRK
jgi:glycerophosphoryl diester phosphodiesterase